MLIIQVRMTNIIVDNISIICNMYLDLFTINNSGIWITIHIFSACKSYETKIFFCVCVCERERERERECNMFNECRLQMSYFRILVDKSCDSFWQNVSFVVWFSKDSYFLSESSYFVYAWHLYKILSMCFRSHWNKI